mgnify:CR=1 FL=1
MTAEKISLDIDIFSEVFLYLYTRKPTLYMDIYILDLMGSNRTFMELKSMFAGATYIGTYEF